MKHLSATLDSVIRELPSPFGSATVIHPLFGPFLARSILEISCTALIARFDPFRVLTLAALQSHGTYEFGKRVAAALQWQGDVMADGKAVELWTPDRRLDQMSRALLGDYLEAVVWRPSFEALMDACERVVVGPRASTLRGFELAEFLPRTRALAAKTFSMASKGVHHEFLLPHTSYYDDATLRVLIEDAVHVAGDLGLVANCCEHIPFSVPPVEALSIYERIQ